MRINEYRVIKNNYGLPQLSVRQSYQINYNNEPDIIKLSYILDELFELSYLNEEYLYVISLDTAFHIKGIYEAGHGDCSSVAVYSRELFTFLLLSGAEQFVVAHNHPNGILESSDGDKSWTISMNLCANILHIKFLDHIIMTEEGVISVKNDVNFGGMEKVDWDSIHL